MPEVLDVPFGGLQGLIHPNRVPFQQAITATDCFLDDDTVSGRTGYRSLLPSFIAGSGNPQFMGRFQPSLSSPAQTVVVISGDVWLCTDSTTELLSDGIATKIGTGVFGASDNISGAQEGSNYYLSTDNATPKWVRITIALALETLQQLPTPATPSFSLSSLAFTQFAAHGSSRWTYAGGLGGADATISPWIALSGTIGGTATYDLTNSGAIPAYNWANTKWLLVACSPETISGGGGQFSISLGNAANTFVPTNTIVDPPNTSGSPFCVYVYMVGLDPAVTAAITQIQFTQVGPTTDPFCVLGFMPVNTPPQPGTIPYYVTYFNSVTGSESALSPVTNVVYNNNTVVFPTYTAARWFYNDFIAAGTASTNPDTLSTSACFNKGSGLAFPASTDFAPVYTFNGTIPAAAQYANADTVRLYRGTTNEISLVGSSVYSTDGTAANAKRADGSSWTTGTGTVSDLPANVSYWQAVGTTWSITDNTGASAAANQIYEAGGPGPRTVAMCSIADRLVAAYGNRIYISSFDPVTAASDLIPEWPPIAIQDSDGWSFDIDPAPTEQILSLIAGDALYILTNERVLVLRDLTPGTVPFEVLNRGVIGRQAACYAEEQLMWAAYDGIYSAQNVSQTAELSQSIRKYVYQDQFVPDSTVAIGYQERKLHVFKGNQRLRYDFVTQKWTGPDTLVNSVFSALSFSVTQQESNFNFLVDTFQGGTVTLASHTPDVGDAWVHMTAGSLIGTADVGAIGNVRGHNALPDDSAYYYNNTAPPSANYNVSMQIYVATVFVLNSPEICGRMLSSIGVGGGTYYGAFWSYNGGSWELVLQKVISGTPTLLGTYSLTPVQGQTYALSLSMQGDQISLLLNGSTIIGPVTDTGISAANYAGLQFFDNTASWTDTALFQGHNFTAGNGTVTYQMTEQLWALTDDLFIDRFQPFCATDNAIGSAPGTVPPDWRYSTGFSRTPKPGYVNELSVLASGVVTATVAKTLEALEPDEGRLLVANSQIWRTEVDFPGPTDLRGKKFRLEFSGANTTTLYTAYMERELIDARGG